MLERNFGMVFFIFGKFQLGRLLFLVMNLFVVVVEIVCFVVIMLLWLFLWICCCSGGTIVCIVPPFLALPTLNVLVYLSIQAWKWFLVCRPLLEKRLSCNCRISVLQTIVALIAILHSFVLLILLWRCFLFGRTVVLDQSVGFFKSFRVEILICEESISQHVQNRCACFQIRTSDKTDC